MNDWHLIPNAWDGLKWHQNKGNLQLNFFLSVIFVGMVLNGYDGTIISGLQAMDSWNADLGNPNRTKIGLLNACGNMSGFVVGPIITWIDEKYGRKWGIRFYSYTLLIGSVIGCCAGIPGVDGYALFVTGRAIIGLGLASFLLTSLAVVQEITHPRNRVTIAHSWNSYWILGSVIANFTVFGTSYIASSWGWRIPYLMQVPMALYILIAVQFMPETPRFLMSVGREEEAMGFLVKYHGNGNPDDELVLFEFEEIKEAIKMEKIARGTSWKTLLSSHGNQHRLGLAALMSFMVSLSGSSIFYYYYTVIFTLAGITGASTQTGINAGLSMFTWFCQIAAVLLGKKVGRRPFLLGIWPLLLVCLAGVCAALGVSQNNPENRAASVATVVMVWLYLGFFNFSNPVLWSYPAEVQTFTMRSKGLLLWNQINQLCGAYTTWVDSIALGKIGYKYVAVYIPLVVIQWGLAYKFMVEAKGLTLEQIAEVFDGPGSFTSHAHHQHLSNDDVEARRSDPFADDVAAKEYVEDK